MNNPIVEPELMLNPTDEEIFFIRMFAAFYMAERGITPKKVSTWARILREKYIRV
jgi:hypothetical protein